MVNLINLISKYSPFNEEELKDKEVFLEFLKNNPQALFRENLSGHVTASSWIVNPNRNKVLMVYHNIYDSWSWTGGHADGDECVLNVAIKEAKEETGVSNLKVLSKDIFSIEILTVDGHYKKNKYVNSHLHYNVTFLFEASESSILKIKEDENKGVRWINIDNLQNEVREKWMYSHIYRKLNNKLMKVSY